MRSSRNHPERFQILLTDFLDYEPAEKFDSIVIMGVIEHLPNYERVLKKFARLLRPGGHVFLDGSAARKKYELSSFMVRHIYAGNHSFLVLHDFMDKFATTPFELIEVFNDRHSYYLTFRQWAINLENSKDTIIKNFGEFEYRKFRPLPMGRGVRIPGQQPRMLPHGALPAEIELEGKGTAA